MMTVIRFLKDISEYRVVDIFDCLIESQDWVENPSCVDPTDVSQDNKRLANLCGNAVVRMTS